uniref:Uncharacterized protein n=1 Tax=Mucochytrium quahogii TaxID=96639 RepID=A0A7S2WN71_9STRA|mmetsp:Transcript_8164/g.13178  ORF Transcript_8164/g.13178 Transcript_8164/m.13178 type:complete len:953 (+) Transcript_8164:437-3295(+)|eukprot:CAMPEP_0203762800 /NCGR_PEP_ID=MMETSP0098-20131031/15603_1 /ASSEMBLY_ACC=CAM_ASM_000208 /TAXON_ID=96639 /ORGANISM=" , Strain NY0313808BC1" /LENGTH=952 /DNA_ID=CAMNT_0050657347 /DNA_START=368 /DNA_END=3226 /DNA_ORIENTATION=+
MKGFIAALRRWLYDEPAERLFVAFWYAAGMLLPLALTYANIESLEHNQFRYLIPIFYAIVLALAPPFQGVGVLMFGAYIGAVIPGIAVVTAAVAATVAGGVYAGYLVLVGYFIICSTLSTGFLNPLPRTFMFLLVLVTMYAWYEVEDLAVSGLIYSVPLTDGPNSVESKLCEGDPIVHFPGAKLVQEALCKLFFTDNRVSKTILKDLENGICRPWPKELIDVLSFLGFLPKDVDLNSFFGGTDICLKLCCGGLLQVNITPGLWIVRVIWELDFQGFSIMKSVLIAMGISFSCCALVLIFFPQNKAAHIELEKKLSAMLISKADSCETELTKLSDEVAIADYDHLEKAREMSLVAVLELNYLYPGLSTYFHSQWIPIITSISRFNRARRCFAIIHESRTFKCDAHSEALGLLAQKVGALLRCSGETLCIVTATNSGHILKRFFLLANEIRQGLDCLEQELTSSTEMVEYGLSPTRDLYGDAARELIAATKSVFNECFKLLQLRMQPPVASKVRLTGYLLSFGGLVGTSFVPYIRWAHALASMCIYRQKGKRFSAWLTHNDHVYHLQLVIVWVLVSFPPILYPDVRNWMLYPVGFLPVGSLGKWLFLPVTVLMQPSVEGTTKKGVLRFIGTLFGVLFGWLSGLALQANLVGGCALIVTVYFICVFIGIDAHGELSIFEGFNGHWGYSAQVASYTTLIVATDAVFFCSNPADAGSLCSFSVSQISLLRLVTQSIGIAVSVIVANLVFPQFSGVIVREKFQNAIINHNRDIKENDSVPSKTAEKTKLDPSEEAQLKVVVPPIVDTRIKDLSSILRIDSMYEAAVVHQSSAMFAEFPAWKPDEKALSLALLTQDMMNITALVAKTHPTLTATMCSVTESFADVIRYTARVPAPFSHVCCGRYYYYSHLGTEAPPQPAQELFNNAIALAQQVKQEHPQLEPFLDFMTRRANQYLDPSQ